MPWFDPSDPFFAWVTSIIWTFVVGALGVGAGFWFSRIGLKSTDRMVTDMLARVEASAESFKSGLGAVEQRPPNSYPPANSGDVLALRIDGPKRGEKEGMMGEVISEMTTTASGEAKRVVRGRLERTAQVEMPILASELLAGVAETVLRPVLGDLYQLKFRRVISWDEADLGPDSMVRVVGRLPASDRG